MMVQSITKSIEEWKSSSELSPAEQSKFNRMEAFQQLTNLQMYIRDEIEHYNSIEVFVELLRVMGVLCHPHLSIQNMEGTFVHEDVEKDWENEWIFEFDINGKEAEFSLPPPKNADFFEDVLEKFNHIIKEYGLQSQFVRLNVIGDLLDKPTIEIALLKPATIKKMMGTTD